MVLVLTGKKQTNYSCEKENIMVNTALTNTELKTKIRTFLNRFFKQSEIGDDDNFFELGFVNSLFAMQLVMFVEKEFNIEIDNEDIDMKNFSTINNIGKIIMKKLEI